MFMPKNPRQLVFRFGKHLTSLPTSPEINKRIQIDLLTSIAIESDKFLAIKMHLQ